MVRGGTLLALLIASACLVSDFSPVLASEVLMRLQLDVVINGVPSHMIGSFVLFDDRRIGATANELKEVGLDIGPRRFPEDIVRLDDISGIKYEYDEPNRPFASPRQTHCAKASHLMSAAARRSCAREATGASC